MILSRTLAKRRIAAETRPGVVAAWSAVLIDALLTAAALAFISPPLMMAATDAGIDTFGEIFAFFFLIYFVPFQAIVILSTIWAVKSRWIGDAERNPDPS